MFPHTDFLLDDSSLNSLLHKSFENQQMIKKMTHSYKRYKLMAIYNTTWTYSRKSYIFVQYKIQNTRMTHSTNHRRITFTSINRNHDTTSFSQFLISPNLWVLLKFSLRLLRCNLIVMLQLFAYETFGLNPTNPHLPEFLTFRFNHELAENQVHQ